MNQRSVLNEPINPAGIGRLIIDHNPFFLVSGVLMLVGCFMVNGSVHDKPLLLWPVVLLIVVFNIYEGLIIMLAVRLARTRRYIRDAGFLLLLEVLLLSDATLAYNEVLLKSLPAGMIVCSIALALAGTKLWFLDRGLRLKTTTTGAWMMTVCIGLIFLLPGVFRELIRHEWIHEGQYYLTWWLVSALPLLAVMTQPWFVLRRHSRLGPDCLMRWTARLLIVIPIVSVVLHLCGVYYVDDRTYYFYNLSPLILGLTAAWAYTQQHKHMPVRVGITALLWACIAVILSSVYPNSLERAWTFTGGLLLMPTRVTLIASGVLLVIIGWRCRAWFCVPFSVGMFTLAGLGHDLASISRTLRQIINDLRRLGSGMIPDTQMGWGAVAVAGAFVCLAFGVLLIRMQQRARPQDTEG